MRPRQALARLGNSEVAIVRIGAQAIGLEVLVAIMADGDALFRPCALYRRRRARLGLAIFGLERLSRGGFGGGVARRRFFLRGGWGCRARRPRSDRPLRFPFSNVVAE